MKLSSLPWAIVATLLHTSRTSAFPALMEEMAKQMQERSLEESVIAAPSLTKRVAFDPVAQLVSTSDDHAFVPPTSTDLRGPCPGLNAMANHGYIPHNGVATIDEFITGTNKVFGMGEDLGAFLAIYGAVFDGDLTSYSIGGPPTSPNLLSVIGLLDTPQGLSGSHNKYEGDVSPTRGDLYEYKNSYLLQLSQFTALYELGMANDNYDLDLLTSYRVTRFQESVSQNPYFFNAPFSGVIASPAAWSFIYRFMGNKSAEFPEGQLNGEVLKSFYSVTGDYPNFKYTPGWERIPDNWYTRNAADPYSILFLLGDAVTMLLEHLEFASIGGNTGTVNSFVGLDPANLTEGIFDIGTLLEGNNLFCYAFELVIQALPDLLLGLFADINAALDKLSSAITNITGTLGCPTLNAINLGQFNQFPGYANLKSNGEY